MTRRITLDLEHAAHGIVGYREGCRCRKCSADAMAWRNRNRMATMDPLSDWQPGDQPAPGWWRLAECAGRDLAEFFKPTDCIVARLLCWACPVATDCLAAAMIEETAWPTWRRHGVRGGLLPTQRTQLAEARKRQHRRAST